MGLSFGYLREWAGQGGFIIKTITAYLPRNLKRAEIHVFADWHLGDRYCSDKLINMSVRNILSNPNAYCLFNGDICNWGSKTSVSDVYSEQLTPDEQVDRLTDLFKKLKDKIISVTPGNHELRARKTEGIDITRIAARNAGILNKYTNGGAFLCVRVGESSTRETNGSGRCRQICYTMYVKHGRGGGKQAGAKVNRLSDMAATVDADIYVHSHTHLPAVFREGFYRADVRNNTVSEVDKLFVNSAAALTYGGYGEENGFKPASRTNPVIYLDGCRKKYSAEL